MNCIPFTFYYFFFFILLLQKVVLWQTTHGELSRVKYKKNQWQPDRKNVMISHCTKVGKLIIKQVLLISCLALGWWDSKMCWIHLTGRAHASSQSQREAPVEEIMIWSEFHHEQSVLFRDNMGHKSRKNTLIKVNKGYKLIYMSQREISTRLALWHTFQSISYRSQFIMCIKHSFIYIMLIYTMEPYSKQVSYINPIYDSFFKCLELVQHHV